MDADAYLIHVCAIAGFDGVAQVHVYDDIARYYQSLQPGWFPLGPLPLVFWLVDWPLWFVKVPQIVIVSISFATFALIARRLFASRSDAVIAAVLALCAWQFRAPHDPVIGTSLVTPWFAELILLSFAGWLSYRDTGSRVWLRVGGVALLIAMLTDPLSWGFACLLIAVIALSPLRRRVAWPMAAIATCAIILAFVRGGLPFNLKHGGNYLSDVVAQLAAALPTSYRAFGHLPIGHVPSLWHGIRFTDDRFVFVPPITAWGWFAVAACTIAVSFATLSPRLAVTAFRREALLLGLGFWFIPALLPGPPGIWQSGLPLGQAYPGVYFEYFGVAVLATLLISRFRASAARFARLTPSLVILGVFILCYGNQRADAVSLERSASLDDARSLVQRAASAGFFKSLAPGATIAVQPGTPFADGLDRHVSDARYAIYHYAGMRFNVVSAKGAPREAQGTVWLLQWSRATGVYVTLTRLSGSSGRNGRTDRAFGYNVLPDTPAATAVEGGGLSSTITPLDDGQLISVRRLCGNVPADQVFEPQRPTLALGYGFSLPGPSGYSSLEGPGRMIQRQTNGTVPVYPRLLMAARGSLYVTPTACPLGVVDIAANFNAASMATVVIGIQRRTVRFLVSPTSTSPTLRYTPRSHAPLRIDFLTDAPVADFNPISVRYERDVPRELRLVMQPVEILERPAPPRAPSRAKASRWR
jgi:hypothetical protein